MKRPRIIVAGALANKAGQGGEAWVRLSWVLGLQRLGYDVLFLEEMHEEADLAVIGYFRDCVAEFGLAERAALIGHEGKILAGLTRSAMLAFADSAEALINISGHLTFGPVLERVRPRVYVDIDPGFTQFWHASGVAGARLKDHDAYFTVGRNIGAEDCEIPTCGIAWQHTWPPAVLEQWPVVPGYDGAAGNGTHFGRFTTVANWRGAFGPVQFGGKTYGLKVHEFRKFIALPRLTGQQFEIALRIHPEDRKDLEALLAQGWVVVNPEQPAASLHDFRRYVQTSSAEFSAAQGIYVATNSGWFSDRTVRYLASGRPALVQDTGFRRHLPTGEGLLAFETIEQAVEGAERIARDYAQHCIAARRIAEEYFDSDRVIGQLLEELGIRITPARRTRRPCLETQTTIHSIC